MLLSLLLDCLLANGVVVFIDALSLDHGLSLPRWLLGHDECRWLEGLLVEEHERLLSVVVGDGLIVE